MATNDIQLLNSAQFGAVGTIRYNVAASSTLIYPGEPVARAQGGIVVTPMATNKPVI